MVFYACGAKCTFVNSPRLKGIFVFLPRPIIPHFSKKCNVCSDSICYQFLFLWCPSSTKISRPPKHSAKCLGGLLSSIDFRLNNKVCFHLCYSCHRNRYPRSCKLFRKLTKQSRQLNERSSYPPALWKDAIRACSFSQTVCDAEFRLGFSSI